MDQHTELVQQVNKELAIDLSGKISKEELHSQLAVYLNDLILHHFEQLISLLYRIDVSEAKIKKFLSSKTDESAGNIIATLIIERQLEKISSRKKFSGKQTDFDGAEKW